MNEKYDDERDFQVEPSQDGKSAVITKYIGKRQTVIILNKAANRFRDSSE